jgi:hypothetical protein
MLRRRRPAADPAAASWSWHAGWPTTATSATPSNNGPSAACNAPAGHASPTTPRSPPGETTTRALGNRWLEILWHCLRLGVTYNAATHTANRTRNPTLARCLTGGLRWTCSTCCEAVPYSPSGSMNEILTLP